MRAAWVCARAKEIFAGRDLSPWTKRADLPTVCPARSAHWPAPLARRPKLPIARNWIGLHCTADDEDAIDGAPTEAKFFKL